MNQSKQLPMQVKRIESTSQRLSAIWQQQSQPKKWFLGLAILAVAGLALRTNQKIAPSGASVIEGLISSFVLIFRLSNLLQLTPAKTNTNEPI